MTSVYTQYSGYTEEELLRMVAGAENPTPMEKELAARLTDLLDAYEALSTAHADLESSYDTLRARVLG